MDFGEPTGVRIDDTASDYRVLISVVCLVTWPLKITGQRAGDGRKQPEHKKTDGVSAGTAYLSKPCIQ